jgi:hypothetical protein
MPRKHKQKADFVRKSIQKVEFEFLFFCNKCFSMDFKSIAGNFLEATKSLHISQQ